MQKFLLTALALILCLSAIGCDEKKTSVQTADPDATTPPAVTTTPVATTEQKPDELPDPDYPEWVANDGYEVVSSAHTAVLVTEDGAKKEYPARIMILKNESKTPAMYFDVIASDNTVLCSNIWRGYCQMYMNNEGILIVYQVVISANNSGNGSYKLYEISDRKAGHDIVELDHPEINALAEEGCSVKIAIGSEHVLDIYKLQYKELGFRLEEELRGHKEKKVYLIADSYLDTAHPVTYSYDEKTPAPDFEDNNIRNKYELEYVFGLYE